MLRRYVHGADLVSVTTGAGSFYYHHDGLGSVANSTSASGTPQWTYGYEPFGSIRTEVRNDPAAPTNLMRFTGELLDAATGLYHLRARQYDPTSGRFLQTDPLAPSILDPYVASYVYVNNRPSLFVDPTGMFCLIGSNPDGSCRGGGIVRTIGSGMSEVGEVGTDALGVVIGTVADLTGGTSRQCGTATCVEGSWLVPPGFLAWTLGHTIIAKRELDPCEEEHELTHVAGYEDTGFFAPLYLWELPFGGVREDSLLEYEAYRAERTCYLERELERKLEQGK